LIGNSDVHSPIAFAYDSKLGQHRPLTLVFAKDRTTEAIREALDNGMTAVYFKDKIFGHDKELKELFAEIVEVQNPKVTIGSGGKTYINLHNHSDIDLVLNSINSSGIFKGPQTIKLPAHLTVRIAISTEEADKVFKTVQLNYKVENFLTGPEQQLQVQIKAEAIYL